MRISRTGVPGPLPTNREGGGEEELQIKIRYIQKLAQTSGFGEVPPGTSASGWVNRQHQRPLRARAGECFGEGKE